MNQDVQIKPLEQDQHHRISEFFYYAVFVPPGEPPYKYSIINRPELLKYHSEWGRTGDHALAAYVAGEITGLVWIRLMDDTNPGYGFVAVDIPELSISVLPGSRGRGIGTLLLKAMLQSAGNLGYPGLSLSVQKTNPAVRLYLRNGFEQVNENAEDYIMLYKFTSP